MSRSITSWIKGFVVDLLSDPRPEDKTLLPSNPTNNGFTVTTTTSNGSSAVNPKTATVAEENVVVERSSRIAQVIAVNYRLRCINISDGTHSIYAFLTPQCQKDYPEEELFKELKHSTIRMTSKQYHLSTYLVAGANRDNTILEYRIKSPLVLQVNKLEIIGGHDVEQIQSPQDINHDVDVKKLFFQFHSFHLLQRLSKRQFGIKSRKALPDCEGQSYAMPIFDEDHPLEETDCLVPHDQATVIEHITSFERSSILTLREEALKTVENQVVAAPSKKSDSKTASSSSSSSSAHSSTKTQESRPVPNPWHEQQQTLSETLVEEDEEFFPKGFHPALSFSIIDGELAFTQVDETQVEDQDPTGGYRIEFITQDSMVAKNTQSQTQTQTSSSSSTAHSVAANSQTQTSTQGSQDTTAKKVVLVPASVSSPAPALNAVNPATSVQRDGSKKPAVEPSSAQSKSTESRTVVIESTQIPTPDDKAKKQNQDQLLPSNVVAKKSTASLPSTPSEKPSIRAGRKSATNTPQVAVEAPAAKPAVIVASKPPFPDGYDSDSSVNSKRITRSMAASSSKPNSPVPKEKVSKPTIVAKSSTAATEKSLKPLSLLQVDSTATSEDDASIGVRTRTRRNKQETPTSTTTTPQEKRKEGLLGRRVKKNFPNVGIVMGIVVEYHNNNYTVLYEDGDFETMLYYQLKSILDGEFTKPVVFTNWKIYQLWSKQQQQQKQEQQLQLQVKSRPQPAVDANKAKVKAEPSPRELRRLARSMETPSNSIDTDKELQNVKILQNELKTLLAPTPTDEDLEMTQPQFGYYQQTSEDDEEAAEGAKRKRKQLEEKKRLSMIPEGDVEESDIEEKESNLSKSKRTTPVTQKFVVAAVSSASSNKAISKFPKSVIAPPSLTDQDKLLNKIKALHKKILAPPASKASNASSSTVKQSPVKKPLPVVQEEDEGEEETEEEESAEAVKGNAKKQASPVKGVGKSKDSSTTATAVNSKQDIVNKMLNMLQKKRKINEVSSKPKSATTTTKHSLTKYQQFVEDEEEEEEPEEEDVDENDGEEVQNRKRAKFTPATVAQRKLPTPPTMAQKSPAMRRLQYPPSSNVKQDRTPLAPSTQVTPTPSVKSTPNQAAAAQPPSSAGTASTKTSTNTLPHPSSHSSNTSDQDILFKTLKFLRKKAQAL